MSSITIKLVGLYKILSLGRVKRSDLPLRQRKNMIIVMFFRAEDVFKVKYLSNEESRHVVEGLCRTDQSIRAHGYGQQGGKGRGCC